MKMARTSGFTVMELMVSTAVLSVLIGSLLTAVDHASQAWRTSQSKAEQFREARVAFETVTRRLSQATLNTYWDYQYSPDDPDRERAPTAYVRQSDLRFRSGSMLNIIPTSAIARPTHGIFFQAPLGNAETPELKPLQKLLNTVGYFLEVSDARADAPRFLQDTMPTRLRSRLMELNRPSEALSVFQMKPGEQNDRWIKDSLEGDQRPVHAIAENIVALVLLPSLAKEEELERKRLGKAMLSPRYEYDSSRTSNQVPPLNPPDPEVNPKHQLPPVVRVFMVALDSASGDRLGAQAKDDPTLGLDFTGLFDDAQKLESAPDGTASDLALLEAQLQQKRLQYRIFNSSVVLRGAKWSRAQLQ